MKKISSKPKWLNSKFKSKPSYDLYSKLWYTLDTYLTWRIDSYIFFEYYNWDISNINIKLIKLGIKNMDINILIFKKIYEYDYKVFKMLLFLYWDLECYLEGENNVKNSLIVDIEFLHFLKVKLKKEIKSYDEFLYLISIRKSINLWTNLEVGMFKKIIKYDIYSKISSLDTRHKSHHKIKTYKKYKKYNDLISIDIVYCIRANNKQIPSLYYESYIEEWYKEWKSEINIDLTLKYKKKIKLLDIELKELITNLNKHDEL